MNIFSVTPDFVSLSATVDNITFNFTQSEVNSLGESNGTWNTIGAISAFESSGTATTPQNEQVQLQLNGFAPSHYNLRIQNVNGDLEDGFMTIGQAVVVSATPLPATLPLFAGGLGLVGFLTKRRKSAKQALAA